MATSGKPVPWGREGNMATYGNPQPTCREGKVCSKHLVDIAKWWDGSRIYSESILFNIQGE
jgi:hypothetical protein